MTHAIQITILILSITSKLTNGEDDLVCPSVNDPVAVADVETLVGRVPVTGVNSITDTITKGPLCRVNGLPILDSLSPDGLCTDVETALKVPTCNYDDQRSFGYGIATPMTSSVCYALAPEAAGLEAGINTIKSFSKRSWIDGDMASASTYGPFTSGTTSVCKDSAGTSSFYQTMHWLVPTTKSTDKMWSYSFKNNVCDVALMFFGTMETDKTTLDTVYGTISRPFISISSPSGTVALRGTYTDEQPGGVVTAITLGNSGTTVSRIKVTSKKVLRGKTATITFNNGAMVPKGYWCLNNRTAVLKGTKGNCDAKCVFSGIGSYNGSKPTQSTTKSLGFGICPAYSSKELFLVNGTRAKGVNERGLFGAIAGLIEGAWSGMVNGWFGVASQTEGSKGAASQESTQNAIDGINNGLKVFTEKLSDRLSVMSGNMDQLEEELTELDEKVNDVRADLTSSQIGTLVLLTNQGILDSHDRAVSELRRKLFAQLGPSATPTGEGCFRIKHKCNQTCLADLATNKYTPEKYLPLSWNVSSTITAAPETPGSWRDPTLIAVAVIQLAIMIAGGIAMAVMMRNTGMRCFC